MSFLNDSDESRPSASVVVDIIDGRPWNARSVPHNSLRQHCRLLGRTFRQNHPQTNPLRPAARRLFDHVHRAGNLFVSVHPSEFDVVPALVRIAAYHRQWIRDPQDWQPNLRDGPRQQIDSLAWHLFAAWPMPDCFGSAWLEKGELFYLERDWYCHVARGESLRSAPGMPPSITHRALHLALGAPKDLTIREALRWGQVKALNGSDDLLQEVLASRMLRDLSNDAVWSRLLEKMAGSKQVDVREFGIVADALLETMRNERWHRVEALVSLPLAELIRHARRFWETIVATGVETLPELETLDIRCRRARADLSLMVSARWARMPYVRSFTSTRNTPRETAAWRIEELTCQAQLIAESRAMNHCVSSYRKKCHGETSSIFSLRKIRDINGSDVSERQLTIEVNRQSRRIVQVRGKHNRLGSRWLVAPLQKISPAIGADRGSSIRGEALLFSQEPPPDGRTVCPCPLGSYIQPSCHHRPPIR